MNQHASYICLNCLQIFLRTLVDIVIKKNCGLHQMWVHKTEIKKKRKKKKQKSVLHSAGFAEPPFTYSQTNWPTHSLKNLSNTFEVLCSLSWDYASFIALNCIKLAICAVVNSASLWVPPVLGLCTDEFYRFLGLIRIWQPTPVFLPGKSHGQRNLAGYSPWGCKELATTEQLTLLLFFPL